MKEKIMNFKISITIIASVLTCFIFTIVLAETNEEAYLQTLGERLNIDMQIFERIGKAIDENNLEKSLLILMTEQDEFQKSHNIYKNRPEGLDNEAVKIAERLEQASFNIINGIEFLLSLPEYFTEEDFGKGWNQIISGAERYDEAAIMINNLIEEYESTRNIYLYGLLFGIGGFILFLLLGKRTNDINKSSALGLVRNGFLFIALGFGTTLATYEWASGDTYFIFWGLPIYGGYLILKGIFSFSREEVEVETL